MKSFKRPNVFFYRRSACGVSNWIKFRHFSSNIFLKNSKQSVKFVRSFEISFWRNVLLCFQTTPSDQQRFVQLISVLTDLIVFLFASILKNLTIKDEICSTTTTTLRQLPENGHPSEFYHLKQILSSQSDSLLEIYDRCASNGEFPFDEQIQTELDDL